MTTQTLPPTTPPVAPPERSAGRTLLRVLGLVFALVAIAFVTLDIVGWLGRDESTQKASYEGVRAIEVHAEGQSIEVTPSTGDTVTVDRTIAWSLTRPDVTERVEGDRLVIRVDCSFWETGRGCGGDIRVATPSTTDLELSTSDGSASVSGITGSVELSSSDGAIRARDVTGPLSMRTSDGSIEATGLTSEPVEARSSDGSVRLVFAQAPSSVNARTSDGGVEVLLPRGEESYQVDAETSDGSREVDVRIDPDSDRVITLRTSDGSVRVAYLN